MPGFQTERFVDLTENQRTELQCIICRDILKSPVFAKCCLQTFCEQCINQWLINNSVCPFDRQHLEMSQLTRPPRLLINMLEKLTISCDYKEKGCHQVVCLGDLEAHLNSCPFNKKLCKICNLEAKDGHICIEALLEMNTRLESQLKNTAIRIDSLEYENQNYLQTIREFCDNSDTTHIWKISENQMLIDARKHWNTMTVQSKSTPKEMTAQIVSIVSDSVNKGVRLNHICTDIRKRVEHQFGGLWLCHSSYEGMASISATVDNNCFVCLKIQKLKLSVHKVYDEIDFTKLSQYLQRNDFDKHFSIYKTDMNKTSVETVVGIVVDGFAKFDNWSDFTENIFNTLSIKLGGVWNCIIYKKFLGHFCVIPKTRQYINFYVCELEFAIFQILN